MDDKTISYCKQNMTKEEYEHLLKSDYWKGFSYSLIKERNFTCADCGRYFPNERNKLQVHHLVYRDIYPWSYRPEEMVVLCEECHKRRHGLTSEACNPSSIEGENRYVKTYSYSIDNKIETGTSQQPKEKTNIVLKLLTGLGSLYIVIIIILAIFFTYLEFSNTKERVNKLIDIETRTNTQGRSKINNSSKTSKKKRRKVSQAVYPTMLNKSISIFYFEAIKATT